MQRFMTMVIIDNLFQKQLVFYGFLRNMTPHIFHLMKPSFLCNEPINN